jgi:hypothetical protein
MAVVELEPLPATHRPRLALVVVVGQPSVPVAQVTQELCRPAFGPLPHSLDHQSDVKEQNRERRRRQGWDPVRHVEEPNPLRTNLKCRVGGTATVNLWPVLVSSCSRRWAEASYAVVFAAAVSWSNAKG